MKTLARPGDVAEIVARLRTLEPMRSPAWGRMSAHQMICHAADACAMAAGERPVVPFVLAGRTLRKIAALWLPVPWPRGLPTSRELDAAECGTRPGEFSADRSALLEIVQRLPGASGLEGRVHPVFGPLSRKEWLRWGYLHLDHHLRQFGA
jgi:hypothetical protein